LLMRSTSAACRACSATARVTRLSRELPISAAAFSPTMPRLVLTMTIAPLRQSEGSMSMMVDRRCAEPACWRRPCY
jgi:hypothetical protein